MTETANTPLSPLQGNERPHQVGTVQTTSNQVRMRDNVPFNPRVRQRSGRDYTVQCTPGMINEIDYNE